MKKIVSAFAILLLAVTMIFAGGKPQPSVISLGAPVKIIVEIFDRGTDGGRSQANNNAWTLWIHDKVLKDLNIEVSFYPVGRWSEDSEIINLMASGSAPDLCYTYNTSMISSFRDQGGIMDLAPYIDRFLPDTRKLLGADPAISGKDFIYRNIDPSTGRIFSIPSYRVALAQRNIFIRQDWLDKLGLPLPKTTREFHDTLAAFRDRDPGNVGKNNVIPFGQDWDARWGMASLIHPFIDPKLSDRERWINIVADVSSRNLTMPGYKEGVRMVNSWYNEGLVFRGFPLMKSTDDFYSIIKSGVVGSFSGNWDLPYRTDYHILADLRLNVPGADLVPVDCIQSSDNINHKDIMDKAGLQIFVPSFSRQQEAALKYLNWLSIFDNYNFLQVGQEGINHQIVNGVPQTMARPAGDPWFQNSDKNIDYTMPMNGVELGNQDLNSRVLAFGYGDTPPEVIVNAYAMATTNAQSPAVYQAFTVKDGIYGQTLRDMADALIAQAVTARTADFDKVWDAGIQDWLNSGAREVIEERASIWK